MKYLVGLTFACFLGVSVYLLLHEGKGKSYTPTSISKSIPRAPKIGEKKTPDIPVYELQRQAIDAKTVYKFESKNPNDNFEMDEEEMDAFSRGLNGLRDARDAGQVQLPGSAVKNIR